MKKHIHKTIHKLRRQPEEVRRQVLHIVTFAGAAILIFLWILSLGRTFKNKDVANSVKKDLQPFSILKDNLTSGYNSTPAPEANQ